VPDDPLVTSAVRRFLALGTLAGRVGASLLGSRVADLARSSDSRAASRADALVRNAARVVETLGRLKGGAMKVGQMLSLHADLLPPGVAEVLRSLQSRAPSVPAEVMEYEARGALPDFDRLFATFDPVPFAAASIGQVHGATLRDGRRVAVKIQYPAIDHIIRADLSTLRALLGSLFAIFSDAEFDPVWEEIRDRLLEELDYTREAALLRRAAELHAGVPEIIVPGVVGEATTRNLLTMEYVPGISPDDACSDRYPQALRDRWGVVLFEWLFRGLFEHRLLHADPNLSNFAFREDGRVVVYDLGCVKEIPLPLAHGYARLMRAVIDGRKAAIPPILDEMGIRFADGSPLSSDTTTPFVELFTGIVAEGAPYTFGADPSIYDRVLRLGWAHAGEAAEIRFPRDIVFVHRTLSGHFGNLGRLRATARWREIALPLASLS
jgi:predicted unusual protein kinase regulating ubiquinone biosynthesis (AarF/ABC1/UbiB family)